MFLINVPIGIAAFAGAVRVLPRTVAHPGMRLDIGGMTLVGLALTAIIYPLIQGRAGRLAGVGVRCRWAPARCCSGRSCCGSAAATAIR